MTRPDASSEHLFNASDTLYRPRAADTQFFDPVATAALAGDPDTPPSRTSRTDAWNRLAEIIEYDGPTELVEQRTYDGLDRLTRVVDADGNVALRNVYDGWGTRSAPIRARPARSGGSTRATRGRGSTRMRSGAHDQGAVAPARRPDGRWRRRGVRRRPERT
jgi:YD repeat-containing protein